MTHDEEFYAAFDHGFDLVDAKEFDQLVDHLRTHGTMAYVDDERLITLTAEVGMPAIEVIALLVESGASTRAVLAVAAARGHVDLLRAACERDWGLRGLREFGIGRLLYHATSNSATAAGALKTLRWVLEYYAKRDDMMITIGDEEDEHELFTMAFGNTLQCEYIDAAAFLLEKHADFGLPEWCPRREYEIENAANEGAIESLDFLCQRWGEELVTSVVREALRDNFEPEYEHDIRKWLRKRTKPQVKVHVERAMSLLDEVKESLPEGSYIQIANEMGKAYKKAREMM